MSEEMFSEESIKGMCDSLMSKIKHAYALNAVLKQTEMGTLPFQSALRTRELAMVQTKLDEVHLWANEALRITRKK